MTACPGSARALLHCWPTAAQRRRGCIAWRGFSSVNERSWVFQVLLVDRVERPISQRSDSAGWIVAGILWKVGGTRHEQIVHVPTLQIAVERAGLWVRAHYRAAAGMRRLIRHDVEMASTRQL